MPQKGFSSILLILIVLILAGVVGFFGLQAFKKNTPQDEFQTQQNTQQYFDINKISGKNNPFNQRYSQMKCQGEGTTTFTYLPLKIEDIGRVEPYGIMVDAHVIPTSHGYISPIDFQSARDKYPVYAIADGIIVFVAHRGQFIGDNNQRERLTDEYQLYFEHSCTFYSYYDLLTSLSPELEAEIGKLTGFEQKYVRIPVKAGQLIGRVGGQTVDFAVWNFANEPAYFVNPKSYTGDEDRFYLDDMFKYFQEPLKSQLLAKNDRTAEPRSGRADYDKEGKLVGNWFREGSGGFRGMRNQESEPGYRYWDGHLSISYDYINPSQIRFSIGNFDGRSAQFAVRGNNPDPTTIGMESGSIKYELLTTTFRVEPEGGFQGTVLLQLLEPHKLKLELFPGKSADQVSGFTNSALIYER